MSALMNSKFKLLAKNWCPPILLHKAQYFRSFINNRIAYKQANIALGGNGFESIHAGESCFILGAGPSVLKYDLSKLSGRNVISVANTYVHPCLNDMNPMYHILPNVFIAHASYHSKEAYLRWLKDMDDRLPKRTVMVMSIHDWKEINHHHIFSNRRVLWFSEIPWEEKKLTGVNINAFPSIHSVSEAAILTSIFLGYKNIYLLGFDHNYFSNKKYFYECEDHKVGLTNEGLGILLKDTVNEVIGTGLVMQRYSNIQRLHPHVFNCNTESYIEIFPKVSFEDALRNTACS